eukprot:6178167-Pleurochrysis_carterae.AAC.2
MPVVSKRAQQQQSYSDSDTHWLVFRVAAVAYFKSNIAHTTISNMDTSLTTNANALRNGYYLNIALQALQ